MNKNSDIVPIRDSEVQEGEDMQMSEGEEELDNEGRTDEPIIVIFEFDQADRDFLCCPIDVNIALFAAGIYRSHVSELNINNNRNLIIIKTHLKEVADKCLQIKQLKGKNIKTRLAKKEITTSYGVIGPIKCPLEKTEVEEKKRAYKYTLEEGGVKAKSLDWISRRVKRNNEWRTEITETLRIEFEAEPPAHVFLGHVKYKVGTYTPEITQCYKCQKFGHTGKDCKGDEACLFCGS